MLIILKRLMHTALMAALIAIFLLLAQDFIKEVQPVKTPDYADINGCDPDVWYQYQECA